MQSGMGSGRQSRPIRQVAGGALILIFVIFIPILLCGWGRDAA
jgi:hypothetical protein